VISSTSKSTNILLINVDSLSEAALNALKRHQLQSLTKRYGLKSNGKVSCLTPGKGKDRANGQNSDMVQRLQECMSKIGPLAMLIFSWTNYVAR
jgi:hypothetical protein